MEMNDTQQEIEFKIRQICGGSRPFATVSDIAEVVSFSERTVLNNADAVVRRRDDIVKESIGKANVYYIKQNLADKIIGENTLEVRKIGKFDGLAVYVEIRSAPEDSKYDVEAHWYDGEANELTGHYPSIEEMGLAIDLVSPRPDSIRIYDPGEVETKKIEDGSG